MIRTIRGTRVMLDRDLAQIYGVPTKAFNQAVKRNAARFPEDFMFRLTKEEAKALGVPRSQTVTSSQRKDFLRSQFVTSNQRGGPRYLPYAFTEYGALMAANILNSPRRSDEHLLFGRLPKCARRSWQVPSSRRNLLRSRKNSPRDWTYTSRPSCKFCRRSYKFSIRRRHRGRLQSPRIGFTP
jgi:hypothetical protein